MGKDRGVMRSVVVRRRNVVVVVLGVLFGGLGVVSPVLASVPTGDFAVFGQCPRFTPGVVECFESQVLSGEFTLGKQIVPIVTPFTLQGGIVQNQETGAESFVGALDGETLSRAPQNIPGGLSSLIDCDEVKGGGFLGRARRRACRAILEHSWITDVSVTSELVRPASEIGFDTTNEISGEGIGLSLPLRFHLENPLLGRECYIGSETDPVVIDLTTGETSPPAPNKPIGGKFGVLHTNEGGIVEITENTDVDNAFSEPEATGCGGPFASLVNPLVNSKLGLPSPAGNNTIVQNGTIEIAASQSAIENEQPEQPNEKGNPHEERGHWPGPPHRHH
jgi:hypothetical protein